MDQYGYLAILAGTAIEGDTVLMLGEFTAHQGYLALFPSVLLAGFAGTFIQNHVLFMMGLRYWTRGLERLPFLKLERSNGKNDSVAPLSI